MFSPQRLREYLDNPMGKGSTAISNKSLIQSNLSSRYEKLLKKHKDFKHTVYRDNHEYYFHFEIPSETDRSNTYDVVIHFTPGEDTIPTLDVFLHKYYLKFFSNCPSFTYTYAYVYNDNGLLIEFLTDKYNDIVLTDTPEVRNPGQIINYEKSLYFACKYIQEHSSLMNKTTLNIISKKFNVDTIHEIVRNTDKIKVEVAKEDSRIRKEKSEEKQKTRKKKDVTNPHAVSKATGRSNVKNKHSTINKIKPLKKVSPTKSTTGKK